MPSSNGFDNLSSGSWLLSGVIYSYISFIISIGIMIDIPAFGSFLVLINIAILVWGLIKGHGKYLIAIIISLSLNGILLSIPILLIIWQMIYTLLVD